MSACWKPPVPSLVNPLFNPGPTRILWIGEILFWISLKLVLDIKNLDLFYKIQKNYHTLNRFAYLYKLRKSKLKQNKNAGSTLGTNK